MMTPKPPYYAVIFTSVLPEAGADYHAMAEKMETLARSQPGYLGMDSVRNEAAGITVSYWQDLESIRQWKDNIEHQAAQRMGKERWYREYQVRVAKVEHAYSFDRP
jgi:heme-degrading monooxygenase HmoA